MRDGDDDDGGRIQAKLDCSSSRLNSIARSRVMVAHDVLDSYHRRYLDSVCRLRAQQGSHRRRPISSLEIQRKLPADGIVMRRLWYLIREGAESHHIPNPRAK